MCVRVRVIRCVCLGAPVNGFHRSAGSQHSLADTPINPYQPESTMSVERDLTGPRGDECKFGGGKVIREGMGQATVRELAG